MFFLITYGMINLVVLIEQGIKIISFRSTLKVPYLVPLIGGAGCVIIMFLINPVFSVIGLATIVVIYFWLARKGLESDAGDIRGGMFLALAESAAMVANKYSRHQVSWKPDLLIPIEEPKKWTGPLLFIENVTFTSGSVLAFTVTDNGAEEADRDLDALLSPLGK